MLATIFCNLFLLAQLGLPAAAPAAAPAAPAASQPATTQSSPDEMEISKIASGQRKLQFNEILDPTFWRQILVQLAGEVISLVPRLLVALVFLIFFWLIYRGVRRVALGGMAKAHVDTSIRDMLATLLKWGIMGFGIVIAFNQVGIQITALLTGVSIIGLAIGFAAQESLANFIAGIVIFWDKPFRVGDWIEIDGNFGQVLRITFRSTRMLDLDGQVIIMPNTHMLANRLSNHTAHPLTRLKIPIGIAYKESIDEARRALLATTEGDPVICPEPAPTVVVTECADSSVNLELRFWIKDESAEKRVYGEYLEKAKKALDQAGIEIPFPHLQLFMEETPALRGLKPG